MTAFFVSLVALFFSDLYADILAPHFDSITVLNEVRWDTHLPIHSLTAFQDDLQERELKLQIQLLSERLHVPLAEVYKIKPANSATVHSNAYKPIVISLFFYLPF